MHTWKSLRHFGRSAAGIVASLLLLATPLTASAAAIQVVVNGQQMHFDQPPVERAGHVFVPLRGVFEKLGASVTFAHGFINATGSGGQSIGLTIGSRNAMVNGNATKLDVAPFAMNGRALVPLRFVSTALGAAVDYAPNAQVVTISNQAPARKNNTSWILPALGVAAAIAIIAGSSHHAAGVSLNNMSPSSGAVANSTRPSISGSFSAAVQPNTVVVMLDGNDVSGSAYISPNSFSSAPNYDLGPGNHTVRVTGRSQSGATLDQSWSFSINSNSYGQYGQNYVNNVYPGDGSTVGGSFAITGTTLPNARVLIAVTSGVGGIFRAGTRTDNYTTQADARGRFYQTVNIPSGSGDARVQITSTAPNTNASTGTNLTYHT